MTGNTEVKDQILARVRGGGPSHVSPSRMSLATQRRPLVLYALWDMNNVLRLVSIAGDKLGIT